MADATSSSTDARAPPAQDPEATQLAAGEEEEEEQTLTLFIASPVNNTPPVRLEHVSTNDTVLALRQLIAEYPALAGYTSYHLEVHSAESDKWVVLNDFVELGEYDDVVDSATLKMVLEKYDARKVRAHVRRFRDILSNPPIPPLADDEAADDNVTTAASATTAAPASAAKATKSKSKKKSKQADVASPATDVAAATTTTNGKSSSDAAAEKQASEISEQQLEQLRAIHAKLEGIKVPVVPTLDAFYTLPGSSAAAGPTTTTNDAKPQQPTKSSKGKKNNKQQQQQQQQTQSQQQASRDSSALDDATLPTCVQSIVFSGYNPPPGPRKLAGDLLYLDVVVADGTALFVTAHVNGFYVNRSTATVFNPEPRTSAAGSPTHLLVDVLTAASPAFKTSYNALLAKAAALAKQGPASIEWIVAAGNTVGGKRPWNTPVAASAATTTHTYDLNRAEDALTASFGMDDRGVLRDWNEEYQCCRELPRATLKDAVVRARVLYKIVTEFVDAATQGAVAIVEGHIPPINPMDAASAHVYVFNSIFFSLSVDGQGAAADGATDEAAYSSANRDLQGVKAFNDADVPGLHTLATAVVDYLGVRVIAQSVIPGILQGEAASKLVYGSVDGGKTIASNATMHARMVEAGEKLHIAERSIQPLGPDAETDADVSETSTISSSAAATAAVNAGGEAGTAVVQLCGPVEAKGILGSDGRMYVLDLVRITPKDATYYAPQTTLEESSSESTDGPTESTERNAGLRFKREDDGYVALLRPELVQLYSLWKQNQTRKERRDARAAAKQAETDAAKVKEDKPEAAAKAEADTKDVAVKAAKPESDAETTDDDDDADDVDGDDVPPVRLNPNVFMKYEASTDAAEAAADVAAATDAARYLQRVVIPAFVQDLRRGAISPADGVALTDLMHSCGINMRYLGRLAALAQQLEAVGGISKYVLELLEVEMIARAAKHVLADVLNADDATRAAPGDALVQLLNSLLGAAANGKGDDAGATSTTKKSSKKTVAPAATAVLDATAVWTKVEREIASRFDYTLTLWHCKDADASAADREQVPLGRVHKPALLRRLCQRNGLCVASRAYDFDSVAPFTLADITGVVPVVKHSLPAHPLAAATQLLERGRLHLSRGALATSYELLQEASALLFQVCGAAHEDAALCSTSLATVLYHAGDVAGAIAQQQRALALYTQLAGLDHHDTAFAHANLALFLHANGATDVAVAHVRRAVYLLELASGPHYPELSALYGKMGRMCQDVGHIALALLCHREALKRGELDRVQAANTLHQMALACALAGGFREALAYEQKVYALLRDAFGEQDARVAEAHAFVAQFTARAVEGAKGRVELDAAAQADAVAHELLAELTIKRDDDRVAGSAAAAGSGATVTTTSSSVKKTSKSKKSKSKSKH